MSIKLNALLSFFCIATIVLVSYFRFYLIGVVSGYAPHEFYFNVLVLFPLSIVGFGLSFRVYFLWFKFDMSNKKEHVFQLILATPGMIYGMFSIGMMIILIFAL